LSSGCFKKIFQRKPPIVLLNDRYSPIDNFVFFGVTLLSYVICRTTSGVPRRHWRKKFDSFDWKNRVPRPREVAHGSCELRGCLRFYACLLRPRSSAFHRTARTQQPVNQKSIKLHQAPIIVVVSSSSCTKKELSTLSYYYHFIRAVL